MLGGRFLHISTHSVRANFFSDRVTTCWNSLPDTVDFSSFTVLSTLLNKSISHSFLEFKFVIRPSLFLYVIFFNCVAVSLYGPLQRAAVRACYVPGCPVHLSFDCVILQLVLNEINGDGVRISVAFTNAVTMRHII